MLCTGKGGANVNSEEIKNPDQNISLLRREQPKSQQSARDDYPECKSISTNANLFTSFTANIMTRPELSFFI